MLTQTTTQQVTLMKYYVEHKMHVSDLILRSVGPLGIYTYIYICIYIYIYIYTFGQGQRWSQ